MNKFFYVILFNLVPLPVWVESCNQTLTHFYRDDFLEILQTNIFHTTQKLT